MKRRIRPSATAPRPACCSQGLCDLALRLAVAADRSQGLSCEVMPRWGRAAVPPCSASGLALRSASHERTGDLGHCSLFRTSCGAYTPRLLVAPGCYRNGLRCLPRANAATADPTEPCRERQMLFEQMSHQEQLEFDDTKVNSDDMDVTGFVSSNGAGDRIRLILPRARRKVMVCSGNSNPGDRPDEARCSIAIASPCGSPTLSKSTSRRA